MTPDDIATMRHVLVIAPHPDDEVLGAGGTIARLGDAGVSVTIAIITAGHLPLFSEESVATIRGEARAAHGVLGVERTVFFDHSAARLDEVPHHQLNHALSEAIMDLDPDTLLLPFNGDIHLDHQLVFASSLVAARPRGGCYPTRILCYETLSETNWNAPLITPAFVPNVFIDISEQLERKLEAMRCYASQQREFPHERSLVAIQALATLRGSTVHRRAAEAFVLVRNVI